MNFSRSPKGRLVIFQAGKFETLMNIASKNGNGVLVNGEEVCLVSGLGGITVAGSLAEVGDLTNYEHGQQIILLAGLNLKENSSGK